MHPSMLAGVLAVAALALAGCSGTGNFDVQQTEPFRIQLEGEPQTVVVSEDDSEAKQVVIDTCNDPCGDDGPDEVTVKVQVTPQHAAACVIKVVIKDKSTGEVLDEREVSTGGGASASATQTNASGNGSATMTTTAAPTGGDGNVVIQNIVVNVKGKDNIVVLTQAIEGSADVDISAASARGNADADASIDNDDDDASSSATTTTSASTTTTTGP